jgi:uncharacterized protein (UPF0332 family)
MSSSEPINGEPVAIHFKGAQEALRNAHYALDGGFWGMAANRAYYAFFYAATALLLTLDLIRSRHSGVLAAFREHFVRTGIFSVEDSDAYGAAFELRNVTDYRMVGVADETDARQVVESAGRFVDLCAAYLSEKGYS